MTKSRGNKNVDVYSFLKNSIQFLELKPGESISESELSSRLGVSRTPIREALLRLSDELLIEIYPQRGTYVSKIDISLAKEMAYMRHVLENEICLSLCKNNYRVSEFTDEILALMEIAIKKSENKLYIQRDEEFHRALFTCANHEEIWNVLTSSRAHYVRLLTLDMTFPHVLDESYDEHVQIVNSIESGDTKTLKKILNSHHDHRKMKRESEIISKYSDYFI